MKKLSLSLFLAIWALCAIAAPPKPTAAATGDHSVAIGQINGNITFNYTGGDAQLKQSIQNINRQLNALSQADKKGFEALSQQLKALFDLLNPAQYAAIIANLNELLAIKNQKIEDALQNATDWAKKYTSLLEELDSLRGKGARYQAVAAKLEQGDLDAAITLYEALRKEKQAIISQQAKDAFDEARLHELRFRPQQALPLYEEAQRLQPDNQEYLERYAYVARQQNQYQPATQAYEKLLSKAATNSASKAAFLNNLGVLYADTKRLADAERAYTEALNLYRDLARDNPAAYKPDVAMTLNNLGNLYADTQRLADAERAYTEALNLYRDLARDNPAAYKPNLATTLNNLGNLYADTQRLADAERVYTEALNLYRDLARDNPAAYKPYLAKALNNLMLLYRETNQVDKADAIQKELAQISSKP